jgi:hypothetical protein
VFQLITSELGSPLITVFISSFYELIHRVLRRIFGTKRDDVTGSRRKLYNEELNNLYSSPSIIRIMKSRRVRWAGHVALLGRRGMRREIWWESLKKI